MVGWTLSFYFARHFAKMVIAFFLLSAALIALATFVEFFNRAFEINAAGVKIALLSLFRVPSTSEDSLPFVVLYGSIAAFVVANRRLELVVARAAGVSAWQFLLPACIVGLLFGVLATAVYNPFAAALLTRSNLLSAQTFGGHDKPPVELGDGSIWVRQSAGGVESIIGAEQSYDGGLGLSGVTAYLFDDDGKFRERIDAPRARFSPGAWQLENATVTAPSSNPRLHALYSLPTNLSPNEVKRTFLKVGSVSFWALPGLAAAARRAGVPADRYELQFNVLLSRPILLLAMVLVAANVSLRFSRSRNLGRMIIAGMAVGFMLYVVMKIARDLGSGGIVPPPLAAWLPAIVATLVGATVLLHLEDG
jgi:lipopolysaccharide export system permease protein